MSEPTETVTALGLTMNPFATPSEDLFGGADRMRQLDELRHLSRWSRRLLVVTGERGVGKSTMYRALSSRLDPGVKAARINANLANEARELLMSIVQGFGIATPAKATPDLLVELISLHVAEQAAADRACLVLVDDAHQVELRALDQLLRLTEAGGDSGLRIVFFAEAYFVQMLDKAIARLPKPLAWHEIRLTAFSHEEVKQYLQLRFEGAGYSLPLPFSEAELQGIVSSSGGLPGKIDKITAGLLDGVLTVREAPGWLPPWHRALAAMLVVTIGITWLVWDRTEERAPAGFRSAAVTRDITSVQPLDVPERSPASPEGTTGPGIMTGIEDVVAEAEPKSSEVATEQIAPTSEAPILARAEHPMPEAKVEVAPEPRRQESAPPPTSPPPAAKPRPTRVESRRGSFDLAWIDAQGDDRFTLQLLGTSSRGRVEEYLARQAEGTPIAAYESHRNAGPWYVVIYGSYSSADAATAASKRLPASIGKVSPWVRRFGSLRTDIKR